MKTYIQQYQRALRLRENLSERLSQLTGTKAPVYEKPPVIHNKITLVHWTNEVIKEIDALLIQIEIAEDIRDDAKALDRLVDKLNTIEEIV